MNHERKKSRIKNSQNGREESLERMLCAQTGVLGMSDSLTTTTACAIMRQCQQYIRRETEEEGRRGLLRQLLDMHDLSGWQSDVNEEITALCGDRLTVLLGQLYFSKISCARSSPPSVNIIIILLQLALGALLSCGTAREKSKGRDR